MKPHRVRMTHNLVVNYGLYREMEVFRPKPVSRDQMTRFHSDDYINFLRIINPDNMSDYLRHLQRCKLTSPLPTSTIPFSSLFLPNHNTILPNMMGLISTSYIWFPLYISVSFIHFSYSFFNDNVAWRVHSQCG